MRVRNVQKTSILAAAVLAAGLSLTACSSNGSSTASAGSSAAASTGASGSADSAGAAAPSGAGDSTGSGSTGASGQGSTSGAASAAHSGCRTSQLSFSSSFGMAEGELLVNLKNTGGSTCSMHGFPGVDLKGHDGTVSATRSSMAAPTVTLHPGQTTNFVLHFPPNHTGGSGVTFTSLVVTPPNETHAHTMSVGINIPVDGGSGPGISVDPVGAGK